MPPSLPAGSLVALDELKLALGITGVEDDDFFAAEIGRQSAEVCEWCNLEPNARGQRTFLQETAEITFYADEIPGEACQGIRRAHPLILPFRIPVVIAKVNVAGLDLDPDAYEVEPLTALLYRISPTGHRICWRRAATHISVVTGWLFEDIPSAIRSAVIQLVGLRWYARGRDPALRSEQILDVINQSWLVSTGAELVDGLPADVAAALARYRGEVPL